MKLKELETQMTRRIGLIEYYLNGSFKNRKRIWPSWMDVYFLVTTQDERNTIYNAYNAHDSHIETLIAKCLKNIDIDIKML
jgi:hypothetical protein